MTDLIPQDEVKGAKTTIVQNEVATETPSWGEILQSDFRRHNTAGSQAAGYMAEDNNQGRAVQRAIENGVTPNFERAYNPISAVPSRHESNASSYIGLRNDGEVAQMTLKLDQEDADMETAAKGGWRSLVTGVAVSLTDPVLIATSLIPQLRITAAAGQTGKMAYQFARLGFVGTALQEGVFQVQQEKRSALESGLYMGAATILSGAIGGAVGKFSKQEYKDAVDFVKKDVFDEAQPPVHGGDDSAGAQRVKETTLEQEGLVGSFGVAEALKEVSPLLRLHTSPTKGARTILQDLVDTPLLTNKNIEGIATKPSVESKVIAYEVEKANAYKTMDEFYVQYRTDKEGGGVVDRFKIGLGDTIKGRGEKLSMKQFREAISDALNRSDRHPIKEVADAAKLIRSKLLDPIRDKAVEAGRLDEGVKAKGASSYHTWVHNNQKINENSTEFKKMIGDELDKAIKGSNRAITKRADEALLEAAAAAKAKMPKVEAVDTPEYGVHFSHTELEGAQVDVSRYGSGIRGAEAKRLAELPDDSPIKHRANLYMTTDGAKVRKEGGLGSIMTKIDTSKLDIVDLRKPMSDAIKAERAAILKEQPNMNPANAMELAIEKLHDGYIGASNVHGTTGATVLFRNAPAAKEANKYVGFNAKAVDEINRVIDKGSDKDVIVMLDPQEFLNLSAQGIDLEKRSGAKAVREQGKGFDSVPELSLYKADDGRVKVDIHDGRHRAAQLMGEGENLIPVRIKTDIPYSEIKDISAQLGSETVGYKTAAPLKEAAKQKGSFSDVAKLELDLNKSEYVLMTPENPDAKVLSPAENAARRKEFEADMQAQGLEIEPVRGMYGDTPENSYIIKNISQEQGVLLGKKYGQESIAHKSGLYYMDGRVNPSKGKVKLTPNAKEFFSEITINGKKEKFQIDIDFDKQTIQPWAKELQDVSEMSRAEIDDISNSILNNINGGAAGRIPYEAFGGAGSLKERGLGFVGYEKMRPWLERDAEKVLDYYVRTMSADIEMTNAFGSLDMADQIAKVYDEFTGLMDAAKTPKERGNLAKLREKTINDIEALRDLTLGTYAQPANPNGWLSRTARSLRQVNYTAMLGGMTISAQPDMARTIMRHGLGRTSKLFFSALKDTGRYKMAKVEGRAAGAGLEMILNTRAKTFADIGDMYGRGTAVERGLKAASDTFGVPSLMAPWNDMLKQFNTLVVSDRILRVAMSGKASPSDTKILASLGLGTDELARIAKTFKKFDDGNDILLAQTNLWDDQGVAELFKLAVRKDTDIAIVTKGKADVPLMMNTELGKSVFQFKTFAFSATNRVFLAGLQQKDAAALNGFILSVALGGWVYALKQNLAGREVTDNPAHFFTESLDRSGVFGYLTDVNNMTERVTRGTVGLSALTGGSMASRYASRGIVGALAGPSASTITNLTAGIGAATTGDINEADVRAVRRIIPYQNIFYLRGLIDQMEGKTAEMLGAKK